MGSSPSSSPPPPMHSSPKPKPTPRSPLSSSSPRPLLPLSRPPIPRSPLSSSSRPPLPPSSPPLLPSSPDSPPPTPRSPLSSSSSPRTPRSPLLSSSAPSSSSHTSLLPVDFRNFNSSNFLKFLTKLFSSYSSDSQEAEKQYQILLNSYPNSLSSRLSQVLKSNPSPTTRSFAAFALCRIQLWSRLPSIFKNNLKETILSSLQTESDPIVLQDLCFAVTSIAAHLLRLNQWPELNLFIFESLVLKSETRQLAALSLFAQLAPKIRDLLLYHKEEVFEIGSMYLVCQSADPMIRVAAVRALVGLISYVLNPEDINKQQYEDLPEQIVKFTIPDLIETRQLEYVDIVLNEMLVLARKKTGILRRKIGFLVGVMLSITYNNDIGDNTKKLAIEFFLSVAEERKEGGCGMIENLKGEYIQRLLTFLISNLVLCADDPLWYKIEDDDYEGEDLVGNVSYVKKSLSRLAIALRGNAIVPNYPEALPDYLNDLDWKKRHAVITALAIISEGTSKALVNEHLEKLVEKILPFFNDPHSRVRWAATNAFGQFSKDLSPELQQQFHQKLVPALIVAMDDYENPRVQVQAVSAMHLFCHNCPPNILKSYLKEIVSKLLEFLQKGKKMLKETALTALGSIASSMQNDFQQYYETVMPYLNLNLINVTENANSMLVAKYIDCITMVGIAVGKEKFNADAQQVVEELISLQRFQLKPDDPMKCSLLKAWGGLCKCLGKDFIPYMSVAMPKLIESAQLEIHLDVITNLDGTEKSYNESMEEVTPTTYALEEKALACNMLCCCAAELKEGLHLWIKEIAQTLVSLLTFKFNEEIRTAAATAMPLLLHSTVAAMEERRHIPGFIESPIKELPHSIIPALELALNKESNTEIRAKLLDSLNECMQISEYHLDKIQVTQSVDVLIRVLTASSFKINEREKRVKAVDFGAGEWELLKEEIEKEEKVCNKVVDFMETLIKRFEASFLPFFDKLFPAIAHIWGNEESPKERKIALCIFYNLARQYREEAFRYYETCLPRLFEGCDSKNPEVRQMSARGIGICAEFGGSVFNPHVAVAVVKLQAMIDHPNALLPVNILAYEAAVSTSLKLGYLFCNVSPVYEVIASSLTTLTFKVSTSLLLSHLPIRNDLQEAKVVHDQLCSMVEKLKENFFDPENEYFPKYILIFTEIVWAGNNLATEQTVSRIIKLLKQLPHRLMPAKLRSLCSSIPLQQRNMLESIFSS